MIYILIAFSLFVGNNVLAKFGIFDIGITPSTYLALALFIPFFIKNFQYKSFYKKNKVELTALLVFIVLFAYKLLAGHKNFYAGLLNALFFPVLTILMLQNNLNEDEKLIKRKVFKIIIVFFIAECSIAIIERILYINFFPATMHIFKGVAGVDDITFRSAGLQNHALLNVLCIITVLLFVLYSNIKTKHKLLYSILGTLALLSFNSRMALLVWAIIITVFIFKIIKQKSKNIITYWSIFIFIFVVLGSSLLFLMLKYNLGGRLLGNNIVDDSGIVRIKVLQILTDFDFTFFLKGHTQSVLDDIILAMNILAIENFWIIFLLKYGLIFLLLIIISFYKIIKKHIKGYNLSSKVFIVIFFFFLASTNNSLDVSGIPLLLFLLSAYSFPRYKKQDLLK